MAEQIIIDTDPGQDDAVALLLAVASPEIELLGVTTVAGNVPLPLTTRNAQVVLDLARSDAPVHAGSAAPLSRDLITAEYVHGTTGLDGAELPEPQRPLASSNGVGFIIDTLRAAPEKTVTLCTLGPLTNLARALAEAPDIAPRIKRVVSMGGAYFEVGNVTPAAEFNIYVDPEAAAQVLTAGLDITFLPLDVTHKVLVTPARVAALRALGTRVGDVVADWVAFFERFDTAKYGSAGAPLHDPCVIAYLLAPEMFSGRTINVEIETQSDLTLGMTVADWWGVTERPANAHFMGDVDAEAFFTLLTERLGRL